MVLRIGVGYTCLAILTAILRPVSVQRGCLSALGTVVVVFVVGVGVMYYDLGIQPPEYGSPLTTSLLVGYQIQLSFILLPIPAGYISGILLREERPLLSILLLLSTIVAGAFAGTQVSLAQGSAPGFTGVVFFASTIAAGAFSLFPLSVMWQFDPNSTVGE